MTKAAQSSEPSMEEILASIRRIISDDADGVAKDGEETEAAAADHGAEAAQEPQEEKPVVAQPEQDADDTAGEDVLELTDDMVAEEAADDEPPRVVEPIEDEDIVFDEPAAAAAPEPAAKAPDPKPAPQPSPVEPERIMSDTTGAAASAAFGQLANTILSRDAKTLEDIVREMLRPMLQNWLDNNLPQLVERLVREEIERVSRGGR